MGEEHSSNGDPNTDKDSPSSLSAANVEDSCTKTANVVPFFKLFTFADSLDKALMSIGSVAAVANGLTYPFMTVLFGDLINSFGETQNIKEVVPIVSKISLKFVYLAVVAGVAGCNQAACWMITGERQASRIRNLYLRTILRQDLSFFDVESNTGEVVGRMSGDTILIQEAMGGKAGNFLMLVSKFVGGFAIAFVKGWLLTLVLLCSIPPIAVVAGIVSILISRMASSAQEAYAEAANLVEQTVGSIRTVASFTGEKHAVANYNRFLGKAYKSGVYEAIANGLGIGSLLCILFCTYAFAFWFGSKLVAENKTTGGEVVNVILAVLAGSASLGQTSPCITAFAAGRAAAFKMFETINRKPVIDPYDTSGKIIDEIRGEIELKDVYFSYPSRPNEQIFSGFSMSIPSGTTVALVGQSGSGKSTVINLIERFYDPQAGEVLIDGICLKEFQLKWIRSKIGLVSQEPVLFTGSIKDNITYGKKGATVEEIMVAADLANATKFIDKLPKGLETMVGERGTQLSGGQKQRVAIARAILKDPRILLLDEATSALDAESERTVQEALDRVMVDKTTVIVAHRLSTVRNADSIAVVDQGKIVEKGTHSELIRDPEGAYSQLVHLQEVITVPRQFSEAKDESEFTLEYSRQLSRRMSSRKSSSFRSSPGNSSRHSITILSNLHTGVTMPETTIPEPDSSPHEVSKKPVRVPLYRLAYLNKPELAVLFFGAVAAIVNGSLYPASSVLLSGIISTFNGPSNELKTDSRFWALMFVAFGGATLLASPTNTYLFGIAGCKLVKRIRSMCFEKLVYMEIEWFDEVDHSSGFIGAKLSVDATNIGALSGVSLSILVQNISGAVTSLVIAFTASWQLSIFTLAMVSLMGLIGYIQSKLIKGFSGNAKVMYEEASQVANDAIGSIRTVASFCAEEKVMEIYKGKCKGTMQARIRQGWIGGICFGLHSALLFFIYASSFYIGARLIEDGLATFSDVLTVFFALTLSASAISQSSSAAPDFNKAKHAVASIFAVLDKKSNIDSSDESGLTPETVNGNIVYHNVSFKYPTRPEVQIFRDLCLTIHSGKTVALVGESGSGKSTVISLLQRFYNPDSGHITLDGIDIQKFQVKWLRRQMGLVSQEAVLFNDTIRANIAYGNEGNSTETDILEAAKLANAHEFISSLQQGYDTLVGERGIQLSGGQKQRVAIARAMIKSPKVLLLDEATSALDAESERIVQEALDRVTVNRTTIVVAHRLSTIKGAGMIVVVKDGVIVEKGKHEHLASIRNGFYASLLALDKNVNVNADRTSSSS